MNEGEARSALIEVAKLCYERGYICGTEGNFSIRLADGCILTTPRGSCKARLTAQDLVLTDADGLPLEKGKQQPSTELSMHLTAYEIRADIGAVVHAHPTFAVAFTVAGKPLTSPILPEVICTLGEIPTAPYATPSTQSVSESISRQICDYDAVMLDHHGALTVGATIWDAYYKLETVEHHAKTLFASELLGGAKPLTASQVQQLMAIRSVYGLTGPAPGMSIEKPPS